MRAQTLLYRGPHQRSASRSFKCLHLRRPTSAGTVPAFTAGLLDHKEAQTTLTYVLTGMGGTFAYDPQSLSKPVDGAIVGAGALCLYFALLGVYLVRKTFFLGPFPSTYQQPQRLLVRDDLPTDEVREGELLNIADRIDEAAAWIDKRAKVINRIRAQLVASPLVFLVAIAAYRFTQ